MKEPRESVRPLGVRWRLQLLVKELRQFRTGAAADRAVGVANNPTTRHDRHFTIRRLDHQVFAEPVNGSHSVYKLFHLADVVSVVGDEVKSDFDEADAHLFPPLFGGLSHHPVYSADCRHARRPLQDFWGPGRQPGSRKALVAFEGECRCVCGFSAHRPGANNGAEGTRHLPACPYRAFTRFVTSSLPSDEQTTTHQGVSPKTTNSGIRQLPSSG